jgi:hypothetical protein
MKALLKPRFSCNCSFCGRPIIKDEGGELVFTGRVIKFPVDQKSDAITKCKICKKWVELPVRLNLP